MYDLPFPAPAGMNHDDQCGRALRAPVPRARGDEPPASADEIGSGPVPRARGDEPALDATISEPLRRSPRPRG